MNSSNQETCYKINLKEESIIHYSSLKYLSISGIFLTLQSCKHNPSNAFNPQNGTFTKQQINAETATLNTHGNLLLAGTTKGAFKKYLDGNASWHQAGLQIDSSQVIDFAVLENKKILAAIKYDKFEP